MPVTTSLSPKSLDSPRTHREGDPTHREASAIRNNSHMNLSLNVRMLILAGALNFPTIFASPSNPDVLVPFYEEVRVGTHRGIVIERIGEPADRWSSDVWVYWDYRDPKRSAYDPHRTLILIFSGDWLTSIRFTDTDATRAALARFRRDQAIVQLGLTALEPLAAGKSAPAEASEDPEMMAAINEGRASTREFLAAFIAATADQNSFRVRIAFVKDNRVEHTWLANLNLHEAKPTGVIANSPPRKDLSLEQRIEFDFTYLSDWMYVEDGKLVGGFTIRLLRERMTPEERAKADAESSYRME
jgi:uncharacterized protein YegJ (DUF2314 family)